MERSWLLTVTTESMESIVLTMVMGQTGLMGLMGSVVAVTVAVAVAAGAVVVTVGAATVETTHALSLRHTIPHHKTIPINIQFPVTTRFHIIILSLSKVRLRRDICVTTPVFGHQFYPDFTTCIGNTLVTVL